MEHGRELWVVIDRDGPGRFGVYSSDDLAYAEIYRIYGTWIRRVNRAEGIVWIEQAPELFATTLYVIKTVVDQTYATANPSSSTTDSAFVT